MSRYSELQEEYFPNLETYTLAITRAHGKNHPETFKVHELFNKIEAKSQAKEDVSSEYQEIRKLTLELYGNKIFLQRMLKILLN